MRYLDRFYYIHKYATYTRFLRELKPDKRASVYSEEFYEIIYKKRKSQLREQFPHYEEEELERYIFSFEDISELLYLLRVYRYDKTIELDMEDVRIYMLRIMEPQNYVKFIKWLSKGIHKHRETLNLLKERQEQDLKKIPEHFRQLYKIKWCRGWVQYLSNYRSEVSMEIHDIDDMYYHVTFEDAQFECKEGDFEKAEIYYYELFYENSKIQLNLLTQYNDIEIEARNVKIQQIDNPYKVGWQ